MNQIKVVAEPQQWSRRSSQLVVLSNMVLQNHDQFKKLKMHLQKALTKERKLFLL